VSEDIEVLKHKAVHKGELCFEGLYIDKRKRIVVRKKNEIDLTYTEFEILLLLAQNAGIVFSKEQIYDRVWKEPYFGDYNIVMSHIRNIREKIEDNPSKPIYIQTVWGVGYKLNEKLKCAGIAESL
jgi:DNA-binding response OmpR family regulator